MSLETSTVEFEIKSYPSHAISWATFSLLFQTSSKKTFHLYLKWSFILAKYHVNLNFYVKIEMNIFSYRLKIDS